MRPQYVIQTVSSHICEVNWVSFNNYINISLCVPHHTPAVPMKVNVH